MIIGDGSGRLSTIRQATALQLSEVEPGTVPIAPGARERTLILPSSGIDGKMWVLHTEQMMREGTWRTRHTTIDNAPSGREVHWSSGLMWLLAALSAILGFFSGRPAIDNVPEAAVFAGPMMLVIVLVLHGAVLFRRFGLGLAAVGVTLVATSFPIFENFRLGDCDHHGLVGWCAMASVLCLAVGGAGWTRSQIGLEGRIARTRSEGSILPRNAAARRWFILAGVVGGAGLWISAATQVPVILGLGLGALAAGFAVPEPSDAKMRPELWRVWGIAGCLSSFFFYFIEYFPFHLGWRLEVNHPLYGLAWLGGAEIIYRILRTRSGTPFSNKSLHDWLTVFAAFVALALPALLIALRPEFTFWVADRFLLALHIQHIREFKPFFEVAQSSEFFMMALQSLLWPALCLATLIYLVARRLVSPPWLGPLLLSVVPCLVMLALAMKQIRWLGIDLGLWMVLAILLIVMVVRRELIRPMPRWVTALMCALAIVAFTIGPFVAAASWLASRNATHQLPKDILPNIIERDIIHRLVESRVDRLPVVLSGPSTSTELAYYGGVHVTGTLYWENMPGLKAAARIFSASSEADAKTRLTEHGVTHILLFSWDDFTNDYQRLLALDARNQTTESESGATFLTQLRGAAIPQWLRPLYYSIPSQFELTGESVRLFEVVPDQTPAESAYHLGVYLFEAGEYEQSAEAFARRLEIGEDVDVRIYLALSRIRAGHLEGVGAEILRVPAQQRAALWIELSDALEKQGRIEDAIANLRNISPVEAEATQRISGQLQRLHSLLPK